MPPMADTITLVVFILVSLGIALLSHSQRESVIRTERAEAAEREQRLRLETILATIADAIVATDGKGMIIFTNEVARGLLGYPEDQLKGRPLTEVFQIVNEQTRAVVENPVTKVLREGKIVGLANHTVLLSRDGRDIPIDDSSAPILDEEGVVRGTVLVFRDVTERRYIENALRESEERFRNVADSAPVLIWVAGLDKKCTWFNRPWLTFTGRTMEQEIGDGWAEGVHPEDFGRCLETYSGSFDRREPFLMEYRLRRNDGEWRWIIDHGIPLQDAVGTFMGYIGSCVDVTEQKQAQYALLRANEALRATRGELQLVTDTMATAVTRCSRDYRYVWVNPRYAEWLHKRVEEIAGRPIESVVGSEGFAQIRPYIDRVLAGQRTEYEAQVDFSNIGRRWIRAVYVPTFDQEQNVDGWVAEVSDVTDKKETVAAMARMNAELQRSNEHLARSNEDLKRFAFVASHDLQEPLRMITIYTQLLATRFPGAMDEEIAMFVDNIVQGTRRMRTLLADLLAYTEVGGALDEPAQTVDLNSILEGVLENLKVAIEESGAAINSDRLPAIRALPSDLAPLLQNLIANAIKYRGEAAPQIHISVSQRAEGLRFAVADNGAGIEPEYHDKIFEVFRRLHGRKIPGTGVGLAICQRVVERYGGRIWVESEAGKGSTFFFTLPRAEAQLSWRA